MKIGFQVLYRIQCVNTRLGSKLGFLYLAQGKKCFEVLEGLAKRENLFRTQFLQGQNFNFGEFYIVTSSLPMYSWLIAVSTEFVQGGRYFFPRGDLVLWFLHHRRLIGAVLICEIYEKLYRHGTLITEYPYWYGLLGKWWSSPLVCHRLCFICVIFYKSWNDVQLCFWCCDWNNIQLGFRYRDRNNIQLCFWYRDRNNIQLGFAYIILYEIWNDVQLCFWYRIIELLPAYMNSIL